MRRFLALIVPACLVLAGSASATHQDQRRNLTEADTSRARAMLVKRSDLPGFTVQRGRASDPHVDCPSAVSEADLTLTGEAEGPRLVLGVTSVVSASQVYESLADARASWRRATSAGGIRCATTVLRRELAKQGVRLLSFRAMAFPRVAQRRVAYRLRLSATTPQGTVPAFVDLVALMRSRAHATVTVATALVPPARSEELRLARIVARRMATAMRGS
ncbi:MAG: hypothetical protein ACRDNY_12660 [Gaiellaceae bacterium]